MEWEKRICSQTGGMSSVPFLIGTRGKWPEALFIQIAILEKPFHPLQFFLELLSFVLDRDAFGHLVEYGETHGNYDRSEAHRIS